MSKHNILFHGTSQNYDLLKSISDINKYNIIFIKDFSRIETAIIDKNPKAVIISVLKADKIDEIPLNVLEKQRYMSYYFLIAFITKENEYLRELLQKSGFDGVLTEPLDEIFIEELDKLSSVPKRENRAILVQGWVTEDNDTRFFFAKSRDLSKSGMLFETRKELNLGQEVRISFIMPVLKENITLTGKIVRSIPPSKNDDLVKYGINFDNIPNYSKNILDRFFLEE